MLQLEVHLGTWLIRQSVNIGIYRKSLPTDAPFALGTLHIMRIFAKAAPEREACK